MRVPRIAVLGLLAALAVSGCAGTAAAQTGSGATVVRNVQIVRSFSTVGTQAVTYDTEIVPAGARVRVSSAPTDDGTAVELEIDGLLPDRAYGAHAHAQRCGETAEAAGPHFQYEPDPAQPSVDPAYANAENEIWLDLVADAEGHGEARAEVAWRFPADRRPASVVIHAMPTSTGAGEAGTAGERAACVTVGF